MVDSETSTSLPGLSRRDVLSTLTAAVSSATVGHPSAKQMSTAPRQDPALVAWQSWHAASRRALALCRKQQRLETELIRTIGFPSIVSATTAPPFRGAGKGGEEYLGLVVTEVRYVG